MGGLKLRETLLCIVLEHLIFRREVGYYPLIIVSWKFSPGKNFCHGHLVIIIGRQIEAIYENYELINKQA